MKDRILNLENELKLNERILKRQSSMKDSDVDSKIHRELLIQRSNLKDLLLDAYRKELSVRLVDDYIGVGDEF